MRKRLWIIVGLALIGILIILAVIVRFKMGALPSREELSTIRHHAASEVYSSDGVLLGRYFSENRTNIRFTEIPQNFLDALIATEDARFFEHEGIDYQSLARVLFKTLLLQDKSAGGGSTLSQQLAKNLYPRKGSGVLNLISAKFREMVIASRLEALHNKEALLTLYLNTISFGEDVYGLETASKRYFNKPPLELKVQESAVLVGMLKANTAYNPRLYPDQATARRNTVISQMAKYGYLDSEALDSLSGLPIELHYRRFTNERGTAPYFKTKIRPMLDSLLKTTQKADGSSYNLDTDGLRITVPIDSRLQYFADSAVAKHLSELQRLFYQHWNRSRPWDNHPEILDYAIRQSKEENVNSLSSKKPLTIYTNEGAKDTVMSPMDSIKHYLMLLQTGVLSMEPATGHIKAWVGGLDFGFFQYDHVTSTRQVGSTFKPIVYAAALESGIKPCDYYKNKLEVYKDYEDWSPRNAGDTYEGYYSLKGALTHSVNTVSAQIILETGIKPVIELAHQLGIVGELPEVPSLALGTANLSLLEMVTAYASIANKGVRMDPVFVLKIENSTNEVIWQHQPQPGIEVLPEKTAKVITNFMRSVVDQGTGASLRGKYAMKIDIAGKTGTTQSYADGWFIGFTPALVTGVWVGADHPGVHFRTGEYGQGARMALPIWGLFMKQALNDRAFRSWNQLKFEALDEDLVEALDCPLYTERLTLMDRIFGVKKKDTTEKKPFFERIKNLFSTKNKD